MAIESYEDTNNNTRLAAIQKRVTRQIKLELLYRVGTVTHCDFVVDLPPATITAMKQEFALLRTEIKTLEDSITGD